MVNKSNFEELPFTLRVKPDSPEMIRLFPEPR